VGSTKPTRKEQIALRVDADVLEKHKAGCRGWQTRMNAALRAGVGWGDILKRTICWALLK
jgi:uncharacterized protein (DUF4415 family)